MRQNQNPSQNQARYSQPSEGQSPANSSPPADMYTHLRPSPPPRPDSPSNQLQLEAAQQQDSFPPYPQHNDYNMPLDPALMEGIQSNANLAELPPSPFLTAGQGLATIPPMGKLDQTASSLLDSRTDERAPTAREEMRRRLNRVAAYGPK
jgi:hypothetical protein